MSGASASALYGSRAGYDLFDDKNYGLAVARYRAAEARLLLHSLVGMSRLIELGCGRGEHLPIAAKLGIGYLGVDPSARYIAEGAAKHRNACADVRWLSIGAEDIAPADVARESEDETALCYMPFNCLGNVASVERVLQALVRLKCATLISVFDASAPASLHRTAYYRRAGHRCWINRTRWGVEFESPNGLRSTGFWPHGLLRYAVSLGATAQVIRLTPIAFALALE